MEQKSRQNIQKSKFYCLRCMMDQPLDPWIQRHSPQEIIRDLYHDLRWAKENFCDPTVWINLELDPTAVVRWQFRRRKFLCDLTTENPFDGWSDGCGYFRLRIGELEHDPTVEIKSNVRSNGYYHFRSIEGLKH